MADTTFMQYRVQAACMDQRTLERALRPYGIVVLWSQADARHNSCLIYTLSSTVEDMRILFDATTKPRWLGWMELVSV
jgi:hypothetical protein